MVTVMVAADRVGFKFRLRSQVLQLEVQLDSPWLDCLVN